MNTAKLNVTVGQSVVLIPHARGYCEQRAPLFGYTVTRISPTGKFEVTGESGNKCFFNAQGYEVELNMNGKVKSYCCRVSLDVEGNPVADVKHYWS